MSPRKPARKKMAKPMGSYRPRKNGRGENGSFFRTLFATPWRQLWITIVIVAVFFWQWSNIDRAIEALYEEFGWGIYFLLAAVLLLFVLVWRKRLSLLFFYWNRWLGAAALVLAAWGVLGFLGLGGDFGLKIIRDPNPEILGVINIAGLVVVGVIFIIPRASFRAIGKAMAWVSRQFERKPAPRRGTPRADEPEPELSERFLRYSRPGLTEKPPLMPELKEKLVPPEAGTSRHPAYPEKLLEEVARREAARDALKDAMKDAAPKPAATPARPKELRQVADEVWKKYGQSPNLVMVDGWKLPPVEILDTSVEIEFSQADNAQRARLIEEALASYGVDAKVVQINAGPTVTQFGVEPGWDRRFKEIKEKDRDGNTQVRVEETAKTRVKVERISSLANDLALALAAPSIRIEAPVPGKPIVGIEVPNKITRMVSLRGWWRPRTSRNR
ncbi:MAG: DNA translocase FtsK [Chloroflexota bacterium]